MSNVIKVPFAWEDRYYIMNSLCSGATFKTMAAAGPYEEWVLRIVVQHSLPKGHRIASK